MFRAAGKFTNDFQARQPLAITQTMHRPLHRFT
jgi:hypothetical protein